jgi:hypothetical protein
MSPKGSRVEGMGLSLALLKCGGNLEEVRPSGKFHVIKIVASKVFVGYQSVSFFLLLLAMK